MSNAATTKFLALDTAIINCLSKAPTALRFAEIHDDKVVSEEAAMVAVKNRFGTHESERAVDRRLQALRKAGKITFAHGAGWRPAK